MIFRDTNGLFIAKITDFGYSTILTATDDNHFVYMPKSDPWYAPEYHHRGFTFPDAKRMEIFSYGLFCLWFLFYDAEADFPNASLLKERKSAQQLLSLVRELMANVVVPTTFPISNLERFFDSALAHLPEERATGLGELLSLLDPNILRESEKSVSRSKTYVHQNEFKLSASISHFVSTDYRVRSCIVRCLIARSQSVAEEDEWVGSSLKNTLFQLALCHEIGFGVKRNHPAAEAFLFRSTKSPEGMALELQILRAQTSDQSFHKGLIDDLFSRGDIMTINYEHHYPCRHGILYAESGYKIIGFQHQYHTRYRTVEAESRYKQEIGDFDIVFGHDNHMSRTLRYVLSRVFKGQGRFDDAQQLLINVHDRDLRLLGWSHKCTLESALALASIYRNQGLSEDAATLEKEVVHHATKYRGLEDDFRVSAMNNLAASYYELRRFDEAEKLLTEAIEIKSGRRGIGHPDTLTTRCNLAAIYSEQLRHQDAERLQKEILDTRLQVLGPKHPDTLISRAHLSGCFFEQGRLHEALEVEKEILDIRKNTLGSSHPDTLQSMSDYAMTLWELGLRAESQEFEEQVVVSRLETSGSEHPDTLKSIANLAASYCDNGYPGEAEPLFSAALEAMHRVFNSEHPYTLDTMDNLASVYIALHRWEDAMRLYTTIVSTREKILGVDHEDTIQGKSDLAYVVQMHRVSNTR